MINYGSSQASRGDERASYDWFNRAYSLRGEGWVIKISPELKLCLRASMRVDHSTFFDTPEKFLFLSVIDRGVRDLAADPSRDDYHGDSRVTHKIRANAKRFFDYAKLEGQGLTFRFICEALDIDMHDFISSLKHQELI